MGDTPGRLSDKQHVGMSSADDAGLDEDSARRAREIRSEIAQTREDMSETIDAIQERLRPGNIAAAATDRVKHATTAAVRNMAGAAGEKAQGAMESTRRMARDLSNGGGGNSIAGAMIGIGSIWLLANRWRNSRRRGSWYESADYPAHPHSETWHEQDEYDDYEPTDMPSGEGLLSRGSTRASTMAHEARQRAMRSGRRARSGFEHLLESNPLMVGAAAMAVGAAVGLALPETERENEWLGETKENLKERAQDMARNTVSQVRQAAGDVADKVVSGEESGDR